jgi:capsular exopolysaccharide synthesis family protein
MMRDAGGDPLSPAAFSPHAGMGDATGRLEPLAVPFGRFSAILRRHLWVVVLTFVVGFGGAAAVVSHMPKQYTAEAAILIEPQRTQVSDLQAISPDPGDVGSLVRTQIDVLRSPGLARGAVKTLQLIDNPEFSPHPGGMMTRLKGLLATLTGRPAPPPRVPSDDERLEVAAAILAGKMSFANETRSSVLRVAVTTGDADLSASIANEIARQFLDFKRQEKFTAMQRAHEWFQDQLATLGEQLRLADLAVEQYRQQHRLDEQPPTDGAGPPTATVNRQQLEAIGQQLAEVSREGALKEAQLAQAQRVMRGEMPASALPEVLVAPVIGELMAQVATAAGHEAQLATAQGGGNPELASVRGQLRKLQTRLAQEMGNVVSGLETQVRAARTQEDLLRQRLEELRGVVSGENSAQVGLQALQTKARATRSIYESFLTRATQLANVAGIQEPDASLVSAARPPLGPSAPQPTRLLAVAGLLSAVVGVALAIVIERTRGGFSVPEQIEATLGLPLLAAVPTLPRRAQPWTIQPWTRRGGQGLGRWIPRRRRSPGRAEMAFIAALDKLRGQLRALGEGHPRLLMVTSALPREGKSVFAAGLARNAAAAGLRVMLLECDFGCPSLAGQFGLPPGAGLGEILTGRVLGDRASVIHETAPRLHVITAGGTEGDPQELLASSRMTELLAALRARYDLVILDTPPVLPVADALLLARRADATLLVVRWEATARAATQDALRLLHASRARIAGTVMTRVDLRTAAMAGGRMSYALRHSTGYLRARIGRS